MATITMPVNNIKINLPESVVIKYLTLFNPSNLFGLIDSFQNIANFVRDNLSAFVDAYRNHPDFLDEIIWFNFDNTYDRFINVLRMHHFITTTEMDYFINQNYIHLPEQLFTIPRSPKLVYKVKFFTYLLSKSLGFRMCFRMIMTWLTDFDIDVETDDPIFDPDEMQNYLNILIKLLERYPDFCKFENNSDENMFFIFNILYYFEEVEKADSFDWTYNDIDEMISHGATQHYAFKHLLQAKVKRQQFMFYLDLGFSSKNASYLVDNPPTHEQIEQFNSLKNEIKPDVLFDIVYNKS